MLLPVIYKKLSPLKRKLALITYASLQEGNCIYCKEPLKGPVPIEVLRKNLDTTKLSNYFFDSPIHLHYSFNTGLTTGAVHAYCSGVMRQYHGE